MRLVSTTEDGTLKCSGGPINLEAILQSAGLTGGSQGLDNGNEKLTKRFMDPTEYTKKLRKSGRPTLTFEPWRRGVLVRLVEMLAWRAAGVTDTGSSVADDGSLSA